MLGATVSTDKANANKFRISYDVPSLLPQYRASAAEDFLQFAEDAPENLTLSKQAHYNEDFILGRSEPYVNYGYSLGTKINFTGKLVAMGSPKSQNTVMAVAGAGLGLTGRFVSSASSFVGIGGKLFSAAYNNLARKDTSDETAITTFEEVTRKVAWLESLTYPQYDAQGKAYPPPRVWLQYGQNFKRRGLVVDVGFTYHGPWEVRTLLCMYVECSVGFIEVNLSPKGWADAKNLSMPEMAEPPSTAFTAGDALDNARSIAGL